MSRLMNWLFGCTHKRFSFPQTPQGPRRPLAARVTGTYVVCLECGREFPYSLSEMKIINQPPRRTTYADSNRSTREIAS